MKRLVLLGEGQGEVNALPILVRRLLKQKEEVAPAVLYTDKDVLRAHNAASLVTWDKQYGKPNYSEWIRFLKIASKRRDLAGVLAVFDGDDRRFPAGGPDVFCALTAAKLMAGAAQEAGGGKLFSVAVVFACVEYESWLIAGAESLVGRFLPDGRVALPSNFQIPADNPETHGKGWIERNHPAYRPALDQGALTGIVDLDIIRAKKLRSFVRLEHAIEQLLAAAATGSHVVTPL